MNLISCEKLEKSMVELQFSICLLYTSCAQAGYPVPVLRPGPPRNPARKAEVPAQLCALAQNQGQMCIRDRPQRTLERLWPLIQNTRDPQVIGCLGVHLGIIHKNGFVIGKAVDVYKRQAKTEREAAAYSEQLLKQAGYKPFVPGMAPNSSTKFPIRRQSVCSSCINISLL